MPANVEEQYRLTFDSQNQYHSEFVVDAYGLHTFELTGQGM